jgi:hypothetical protein
MPPAREWSAAVAVSDDTLFILSGVCSADETGFLWMMELTQVYEQTIIN